MATQIMLPRDAEGREIPLDTEVLYDKDNKGHRVLNYIFSTTTGKWIADFETEIASELHATECFSLTPPDSWEKLFEDLDKCIKGSSLCMYYSPSGNCSCCTIFGDHSEGCDARALRTIKDRIRKLRGDGDA